MAMLKIKMKRWRRTAEEYSKNILSPLITSGAVRSTLFKLKLFVRIRQQTIFSCVYEFIVTCGQLFPVHGELNNTVLK